MKKTIKMILDIAMFLLFLTFYDKAFINQKFHEITGILFFVLLIIHICLNGKMFVSSILNYGKLKTVVKINIAIDLLLIANFLWLTISGIASQKTLFPPILQDSSFFKFFHKFGAAIAFVCLSCHIGLHIKVPINFKRKQIIIASFFSIFILIGGIWGLTQSKLIHFFSIPAVVTTTNKNIQSNAEKQENNGNWQHKQDFKKQHRQNSKTLWTRLMFLLQYFLISASIIVVVQWLVFLSSFSRTR